MSTNTEQLEAQIERLVQQHIAACHQAAAAAVERAFAKSAKSTPKRRRRRSDKSAAAPKRTPEEIAALGERLYETVCEHPGATMEVLAAQMGARPSELHRPMTHLRRAERVRTVGQRRQKRYFPMGE